MLRKLFLFLLAVLLASVLLVAGIYGFISWSASDQIYTTVEEVPSAYAVVVLGTSKFQRTGRKNPFFYNRMDAAENLLKENKVLKAILSGDNAIEQYNEPLDMRLALMEKGIARDRLVLDYAGFRTYDSMLRAREVFGQDSFIVVSQRFHLERALFIARAKGINAWGLTAEDPPVFPKHLLVREVAARLRAFFDCYIHPNKLPRFLGEKVEI